tara:strand:+ start:711 stop:1202 length:492 start_codon:yes stop_codon:yes gene_type:complete
MPEMTILGWFHTILGIGAVLTGFYTIVKFKIISLENKTGKIYVLLTAIVAGSALGIYNQGGFGIAHVLAVLTLIALIGAIFMEKFKIFGGFSKYFQALGYTSTFLFHMIPAITDFLRRIPIGDPFVDSFEAPLLVNFQLSFLLIYFVGIIMQMIWLKKNGEMQ